MVEEDARGGGVRDAQAVREELDPGVDPPDEAVAEPIASFQAAETRDEGDLQEGSPALERPTPQVDCPSCFTQ